MPCWYCGVKFRKRGPFTKTKDHVIPKSKGGIDTVYACLKCNQTKANMSLDEFRYLRGGIEFYGEWLERKEREKTDWIWSFSADAPEKRFVIPETGNRPVYTPAIDLNTIKQYPSEPKKKKKKPAKAVDITVGYIPSTGNHLPPNLIGVRVGLLTVMRRLVGKWEMECICGAIEHRSSKAVLNPLNTFDACEDCRKPMNKLRNDIWKLTGVEVAHEAIFKHMYGPLLEQLPAIVDTSLFAITATGNLGDNV